jgi:hypothetical protein
LRRDKILLTVGFIAVGLKKPPAQTVRDLQKVQRLCFRDFQSFMGGLVADLAHQVEGGGHIRGKHLAPLKNVDALHRVATLGQGDAVQGEHDPDHSLTQQARLHQAGLRI